MNCPICGHADGACKPVQREVITSHGVVKSGRQRVPIVRSRVGRAGYVGEGTGALELYDPKLPHITFVDEPDDAVPDVREDVLTPAGPSETDTGTEPPKRRRKRT